MFPWFHLLIVGIIWKAFEDFWMEQLGDAEDAIREKLRSLKGGEQLATSPLVKVLEVDNAADTVTILVRGPIKLPGSVNAFMRIEVVISRGDIHLDGSDPPIRVKEWRTVIGDLPINKDLGSGEKPDVKDTKGKLFEGSLGFGYDKGAWLGEGSLKFGVAPMRIGGAIYGGISERGVILGLDAEFPRAGAVPLGPTGLGLRGIGGDFAYNFVARLEKAGIPIASPSAFDYVTWARDRASIDRWKPGPVDKTAIGLGVRTVLCTMVDQGFIFELNPVGFAFLTPGGAFILGGKGVLLRRKGFGVESYFVVDFGSASLAFGAGVNIEIKSPPEELFPEAITMLKGSGQLDVFFSFSSPTAWFFDVGREDAPVLLEVLTDVPVISMLFSEKAEAYLRINHQRIAFGAGFSIGGTFKLKSILDLTARLGGSLHGYIGRDPLLVRGKLDVLGELSFKAFDTFEFKLTGHATVFVYLPTPVLFRFELFYKLDLPWPLPDPEGKKGFGDDEIVAPAITSPLLAGTFTVAGGTPTIQDPKLHPFTVSHTVSERQWMPGVDKVWPDLELVVPFSRRVVDKTGTVVFAGILVTGFASPPGSYEVKEELTKLEIFDLVHNTVVPDVRAVWVDGPDGGTALLHVLGTDPFSWLTAQTSSVGIGASKPEKIRDVFFGFGPPETFAMPRRFDDMFVTPLDAPAKLVAAFQPNLVSRVLQTKAVRLSFMSGGEEIAVDHVVLFLVGFSPRDKLVTGPENVNVSFSDGGPVVGGTRLVVASFTFSTPQKSVTLHTQLGAGLLIHGVRYREVAQKADVTWKKTLLKPGRYRLTVAGKSTAEHPESAAHPEIYPPAPQVDWQATQEFEVIHPETLHPYIYYSTFGDNRRFSRDQHPWTTWTADTWDPALYGFGLPLYRQYHLVVRFLVPYVGAMFDATPLKLRVAYEKGGEIIHTVAATPAPDGSSSMLPESKNWIAAVGGTVAADQELVFPQLVPLPADPGGGLNPGSARLTILFNHPTAGEVPVEDWTGLVSRFNNFREHLAWNGTCLTTFYDKNGRQQRAACPALAAPVEKSGIDVFFAGGIEPLIVGGKLLKPPKATGAAVALLAEAPKPAIAYPPELASAPLDWILLPALFEQLGGLDNSAGLRFGRFAAASSVRFNAGAGDALAGISDTVPQTTIEAVIDPQGRPYALWVRTPEPVDWRRVTATLSIRHVEPEKKFSLVMQQGGLEDDCPKSYAHRYPLELGVSVLPSPDGSSAFLVGDFAGWKIVLPRGEFTLTLKFDPAKAGLPPLRPSTLVGPGSELVTLRFLQSLGKTWPLPSDDLVIPNYVVQTAVRYLKFPPELLIAAYQKKLSADEFEQRILAHLQSADAAVNAPATAVESLESHDPEGGKA